MTDIDSDSLIGPRAESRHSSRALVVDDDSDSREALAILLTWEGFDVATADSGRDALLKASSFRPHIIFLDIAMPEMSGYEVCRRLRISSASRHARIYALSGFHGTAHETRCSEAGFTKQFTKPLDPTVLNHLH